MLCKTATTRSGSTQAKKADVAEDSIVDFIHSTKDKCDCVSYSRFEFYMAHCCSKTLNPVKQAVLVVPFLFSFKLSWTLPSWRTDTPLRRSLVRSVLKNIFISRIHTKSMDQYAPWCLGLHLRRCCIAWEISRRANNRSDYTVVA